MKVILLQDVKKQGKKDQVIDVSDGYANNFLISKGLAVPYNESNKAKLDRELDKRKQNEEALYQECLDLAKKLEKVSVEFTVKTGAQDRVFGTVSSKQISEELKNKGYDIDKKKIVLDTPIDSIGTHNITIRLHKKVDAVIKVVLKK